MRHAILTLVPPLHDAKAAWRARLALLHADRAQQSAVSWAAQIAARVLALPELAGPGTVAGYAAAGHELPTLPLLDELVRRGHRVLLPVVQPAGVLAWRAYAGADRLTAGSYGLPEPDPSCAAAEVDTADVVLVPALGFDEHGTRLGRGGGYYDRLLSGLRPEVLTIGLAADAAVVDALPAEPHDVPVEVVVTPSRTLRIISSRPR